MLHGDISVCECSSIQKNAVALQQNAIPLQQNAVPLQQNEFHYDKFQLIRTVTRTRQSVHLLGSPDRDPRLRKLILVVDRMQGTCEH
jgi:hypothetical protein